MGSNCYVVHKGAMSFHDAEKACYDFGGYHLATVPNMIDNRYLYNLSSHSNIWTNYYWLGLTDMTADGSWEWLMALICQGYCGAMRASDGRWIAQDCAKPYPFYCYGRAQGAPTDLPSPPRTTIRPTRKEENMIKFMADAESVGNPNIDPNALAFYNKEREFIRAVTDGLFANPSSNGNVCTFYMSVSFYGYTKYDQQFDHSAAWSQHQFDNLLESNVWDQGHTDPAYNITDAITGAQRFQWSPSMDDIGYTTLVFLTARRDFTNIPSLFNPFPKFDELVVVSLNGSNMPGIPSGTSTVQVSNDFSDVDIQKLISVLNCH
ncbi:Protein CBR-CLEC-150 [Caenorhabditis briggsae]|uniref:Protein CBR-CLEC-150 n=1 Tax=Caenorhabditis briggsae TaxID=6238 RepID=A8XLM1_CAEBR|nr:Protein CBR-CLEC-150 [Caenorhabditis briggsae]CAP33525.2 Protein CBR-CLEC-150 [Caenorhabditis briggsae]